MNTFLTIASSVLALLAVCVYFTIGACLVIGPTDDAYDETDR